MYTFIQIIPIKQPACKSHKLEAKCSKQAADLNDSNLIEVKEKKKMHKMGQKVWHDIKKDTILRGNQDNSTSKRSIQLKHRSSKKSMLRCEKKWLQLEKMLHKHKKLQGLPQKWPKLTQSGLAQIERKNKRKKPKNDKTENKKWVQGFT